MCRRLGLQAAVLLCCALVNLQAAWASDWVPLFDGVSLSGWTDQQGQTLTSGAWRAENGMMHLDVSRGRGGNILTSQEVGDFELVFEWMISPRSNSGIKYRVKDFDGRILGCEYQIIDDLDYGRLQPEQMTGSLYDLVAPKPHSRLKPPGEFNRGAIVVRGNQIQHWLNGYLVVEVTVGSPQWKARVAASKFADVPGFGENSLGRIMLTDHGDEVWYRNVFLRHLSRNVRACTVSELRADRRPWRQSRRFLQH